MDAIGNIQLQLLVTKGQMNSDPIRLIHSLRYVLERILNEGHEDEGGNNQTVGRRKIGLHIEHYVMVLPQFFQFNEVGKVV